MEEVVGEGGGGIGGGYREGREKRIKRKKRQHTGRTDSRITRGDTEREGSSGGAVEAEPAVGDERDGRE